MKFDDFFIEQVKNSVNIVDVVQGYVRLVKKGSNYQALCPFHSEKTPSFSVSASKQIFKCFGCGAGGDVFAFISRMENLSFPEAVKLVAERNGISLPEDNSRDRRRRGDRLRLLELMKAASLYYNDEFTKNPAASDFLNKNGILESTAHRFQIGYWDGSSKIIDHLKDRSFSNSELKSAGLEQAVTGVREPSLVLPLTNIGGEILNFAFLPMTDEPESNVYTPDSSLFPKGGCFFGLHLARKSIREKDYVILVQTPLEGMLLAQHGIPNVAVCIDQGISPQQATVLGRNTKKGIIHHPQGTTDSRSLLVFVENLLSQGFTINVVNLAGNGGLPALLGKEGLPGYIRLLKSSSPLFEYLVQFILADRTKSRIDLKGEGLLEEIKHLLSRIPSRIVRSEYLDMVSSRLKIPRWELEERKTGGQGGVPGPASLSFPQDEKEESVARTIKRDSFLNLNPQLREEIRRVNNLLETISFYQKLEPKGRLYRGRCPFHPDNGNSLRVDPERQVFKCLTCGAGGDIFDYISRFEELSLPEAILSLAENSDIELPSLPPEISSSSNLRGRLLVLMNAASEFFSSSLNDNPEALGYLDSRRIKPDSIRRFNIGYAPPGNKLMKAMKQHGYTLEEMEAAGLVVKKDSGEYYDKFRNRVMIAIKNLQGKIIGFGGRAMGDGIPKYLNSPETILYNKRNQLFGLEEAREAIINLNMAILVEGYFDCIVPSQFGMKNIVASLGTSLTEQQANLLGGFTRNITVCFDPDSAGQEAAARSINMFLSRGFKVRVMHLPTGMDPDDLILQRGVDAFQQCLDSADSFIDFMVKKQLGASGHPISPLVKAKIARELIPSLLMVPDQVERARMTARAAILLKIEEKLILEEMRRYPQKKNPSRRFDSDSRFPGGITLSEKILLATLLDPDRYQRDLDKIDRNLFNQSGIKTIFTTILDLRERGAAPSVARVLDELDDEERDVLESWAVSEETLELDEEIIQKSLADLQKKEKLRQIKELQEEISQKESEAADPEELKDLLREKERLMRETFP